MHKDSSPTWQLAAAGGSSGSPSLFGGATGDSTETSWPNRPTGSSRHSTMPRRARPHSKFDGPVERLNWHSSPGLEKACRSSEIDSGPSGALAFGLGSTPGWEGRLPQGPPPLWSLEAILKNLERAGDPVRRSRAYFSPIFGTALDHRQSGFPMVGSRGTTSRSISRWSKRGGSSR